MRLDKDETHILNAKGCKFCVCNHYINADHGMNAGFKCTAKGNKNIIDMDYGAEYVGDDWFPEGCPFIKKGNGEE